MDLVRAGSNPAECIFFMSFVLVLSLLSFYVAVLAEWLRRMLKAHVRKSVGSIPTDCMFFVNGALAQW